MLALRAERPMKTPSSKKEVLGWGRKAGMQVLEENLALIEDYMLWIKKLFFCGVVRKGFTQEKTLQLCFEIQEGERVLDSYPGC